MTSLQCLGSIPEQRRRQAAAPQVDEVVAQRKRRGCWHLEWLQTQVLETPGPEQSCTLSPLPSGRHTTTTMQLECVCDLASPHRK